MVQNFLEFFDILEISDLNIIVDPPGKIPFEGSTIFSWKNTIFDKAN
jgi:hypothetical protein